MDTQAELDCMLVVVNRALVTHFHLLQYVWLKTNRLFPTIECAKSPNDISCEEFILLNLENARSTSAPLNHTSEVVVSLTYSARPSSSLSLAQSGAMHPNQAISP